MSQLSSNPEALLSLRGINKSFGATGLSKIEPDKYPEVLKALKALAKEAAEEEEDPTA